MSLLLFLLSYTPYVRKYKQKWINIIIQQQLMLTHFCLYFGTKEVQFIHISKIHTKTKEYHIGYKKKV